MNSTQSYISHKPMGIANLGNTCYVNAVLQALASCDSLLYLLSTKYHHSKCSKVTTACLLCMLEQFFQSFNKHSTVDDVKVGVKNLLDCIYVNLPIFSVGRQEDAHELLMSLINSFRTEPAYSSLLLGQLCCQIRCQDCDATSRKLEGFSVLSVDIQHAGSLYTSLQSHFTEEYLYGSNAYCCSQCKHTSNLAVKSVHIHSPPPVLFLHLKRFVYEDGESKKLTHYVDYPKQLDISALMGNKEAKGLDPPTTYNLQCIITHQGPSLGGGHYVATVRNRHDQQWYTVDDHVVKELGVGNMGLDGVGEELKKEAYILVYQQYRQQRVEIRSLSQPPPPTTPFHSSSSFNSSPPLAHPLPSPSSSSHKRPTPVITPNALSSYSSYRILSTPSSAFPPPFALPPTPYRLSQALVQPSPQSQSYLAVAPLSAVNPSRKRKLADDGDDNSTFMFQANSKDPLTSELDIVDRLPSSTEQTTSFNESHSSPPARIADSHRAKRRKPTIFPSISSLAFPSLFEKPKVDIDSISMTGSTPKKTPLTVRFGKQLSKIWSSVQGMLLEPDHGNESSKIKKTTKFKDPNWI